MLLRLAHLYEGNRDGKGWCDILLPDFRPLPSSFPLCSVVHDAAPHGAPLPLSGRLFYRWSAIFSGGAAVGEEFAVAAQAAER